MYGDNFALYDERSFDKFVSPLYDRLHAQNISSYIFSGKCWFDVGGEGVRFHSDGAMRRQ